MEITTIGIIAIIVFILLIMAGLAIVNFSGSELYDQFNKLLNIQSPLSAYNLYHIINKKYFKDSIRVEYTNKVMGDSIRYKNGLILTLCEGYAHANNLAGLTICAHELGHAFQYKDTKKMSKYLKKLRISTIISKLIFLVLFASICCLLFGYKWIALGIFIIVVVMFILALTIKISTIKVEKEASKIGYAILKDVIGLDPNLLKLSQDFFKSAKQTYLAELLKTMLKWTFLTRK